MEKELYVMSDTQADDLITAIRELEADRERFETIAWEKNHKVAMDLETKSTSIGKEIKFMKDQLRAFFNNVERKSTKTQESYNLLSGRLVMKKATQKIAHDDVKILEWCRQTINTEYVKEKTIKTLDWTKFKADLKISGNLIINSYTGEIVENVNGLSIEEVKEVFDIK